MLQANIFKIKLPVINMAKKRAGKKERILGKKTTTIDVGKGRKGKVAFVLMAISVILLLINGSLLILARNWFAVIFSGMGYSVSASSFLTYGIIWLFLGILMWVTTARIRKENVKSEKWLLLALSIITIISGRIESGILALIATLLYLAEK